MELILQGYFLSTSAEFSTKDVLSPGLRFVQPSAGGEAFHLFLASSVMKSIDTSDGFSPKFQSNY